MGQRFASAQIFVQDDLADDVHPLAKGAQERVVMRAADAQGIAGDFDGLCLVRHVVSNARRSIGSLRERRGDC